MGVNNTERVDDVEALKEVLEKIEEKLISAGKIYYAIEFQIWLVAMVFYFLLVSPLEAVPWQLTLAYWILAFVVFAFSSSRIWKRLINLFKSYGKETKSSSAFGTGIALSWVVGSIIGWVVIPNTLSATFGLQLSISIGFLSFIGISYFGMFITSLYFTKSFEKEMIPAFLIPALAIPIVVNVPASVVYAGFSVALAISLTVLAYLVSAFKALR